MTAREFMFELEVDIRSCARLIVIQTREESRAIDIVRGICRKLPKRCVSFDIAEGLIVLEGGNGQMPPLKDPIAALDQIEKCPDKAVYILKDFHELWSQPVVKRKLRDVVQRFLYRDVCLIVTCPEGTDVPRELSDLVQRRLMPPPDTEELDGVFQELARSPEVKVKLRDKERKQFLEAALGLSAGQARLVFGHVMVQNPVVGPDAIAQVAAKKAAVLTRATGLEFFDCAESLDDVGGLGELKNWILIRRAGFNKEAIEYGLEPPRGILLIGIPGTGKSLSAKAVATAWKVPLVRLDIGSLYNSLLGKSEENMRTAFSAAETIAPCVLWVDEVEKAVSQSDHDGGTSARLLGMLCTWMAERTEPVFLVATANDIERLPAEFLRKGRFDEIFFVNLPNREERKAIFSIHLRKRQRDPKKFDLEALADASVDRTGAEIEQAIKDALYQTYHDDKRALTTGDIIAALEKQVPLSISQRETIQRLQEFVQQGRARPASLPDGVGGPSSFLNGIPPINPCGS